MPEKLKSWENAHVVKMLQDEIYDRQRFPGSVGYPIGPPSDITAMKKAIAILHANTEER